jgi:acyl-homoserine lactone acylase PvdQ
MLHIIGSRREANGRRYGTGGHSYVMVVAFTNPPQAWSIFPYGHHRTDPQSLHYADQTELFANAQFKPAWFTMDEIRAHLKRRYRPGE